MTRDAHPKTTSHQGASTSLSPFSLHGPATQPFAHAGALSPLSKDQTYGERVYHRIFDVGINFWINLLASGAFTFWVRHYEKPIWGEGTLLGKLGIGNKLAEKGIANLGQLHLSKVEQLAESGFLKSKLFGLETHELRAKRAESIVNVFTLQTPGHAIVIPSLTLGAKYKAAIVKHFNRKHYGDAAMHSPDLIARHHAIEQEERPTILGAVMGRIGGMGINMGLSSLIGSENNLLSKAGAKEFRGIDPYASDIGTGIAETAAKISPSAITNANAWLGRNGFDTTGKMDQLSRFLAQDVMYTISTSSSIHPVVNFLRKHIPGMTHKSPAKYDPEFENLPKLRVPTNPLADAPAPADTALSATQTATPERDTAPAHEAHTPHEATAHAVNTHDADAQQATADTPDTPTHAPTSTPRAHVHHVTQHSTLTPRHEHAAAHAG